MNEWIPKVKEIEEKAQEELRIWCETHKMDCTYCNNPECNYNENKIYGRTIN